MTAAQINELRRRAISALEEAGKRNHTDLYIKTDLIEGIDDLFAAFDGNAGTSVRTSVQNNLKGLPYNHTYLESDYARYALFRRREQIPPGAPDFFDTMFIPFSELPETLNHEDKLALAMDPFSTSDEETERILSGYAARGGRQVLVSALSQLVLACRYGLEPAASFRFNITNTVSAAALASIGARLITLSPELPTAAMSDVAARLNKMPHRQPVCVSAVVYGKLPLMLLKRCILGSVGDKFSGKSAEVNPNAESNPRGRCGHIDGAAVCPAGELTDRKGTKFPVLPIGSCMNEIVNSCPIWSADSAPVKGLSAGFFIFTDESSREAENIIDAYSRRLPPLVRHRRM